MKTKEEIIEHLQKVGYTAHTISKITGWMIGAGLKEPNEIITYKKGLNEFDLFWAWLNDESDESDESEESEDELTEEEELVASLLLDVVQNAKSSNVTMTIRKIAFLTDLFNELQKDE